MADFVEHPLPSILGFGSTAFRPLIFGEALFDSFPDGSKVLGGAPFNVAWHLRGFKANPLIVTAVGKDSDGAEIFRRMGSWGVDTSGVQVHPLRPTGQVTARIVGGEPEYTIEARQAYDAISVEHLPSLPELGRADLLYHGSLCIREETSLGALTFLRKTLESPVLIDVNLRTPWWIREEITQHLRGTDWVKMNREEAGLLTQLPVQTDELLSAALANIRERLGLGTVVVTLGEAGSMAVGPGGVHRAEALPLSDTVDPVGAGDAFSAVLALGVHGQWPIETTLRRANDFAGELCKVRGATSEDPEMYSRHMRRWTNAG